MKFTWEMITVNRNHAFEKENRSRGEPPTIPTSTTSFALGARCIFVGV